MKRKIEMRKVMFGNPSLETYGGYVHTYLNDNKKNNNENINNNSNDSNDSSEIVNEAFQRMVAICDVPSDQIPEGLLSLSRGYRSHIEQIRVLISIVEDQTSSKNNNKQQHQIKEGEGEGEEGTEIESNSSYECNVQNQISRMNLKSDNNDDKGSDDGNDQNNEEINKKKHKHSNYQAGQYKHIQPKKKRYVVLISFSSSKAASSFVKNVDGKPYNSFERDVIASVKHVYNLEVDGGDIDDDSDNKTYTTLKGDKKDGVVGNSASTKRQFFSLTPSRIGTSISSSEKQNCAVCLEQLDFSSIIGNPGEDATSPSNNGNSINNGGSTNITPTKKDVSSSIFTTVCNHSFHTECLLQCQDSPCPVCRYDHSGLNDTLSQCHVCGTTDKIYVCLICGIASCWNQPRDGQVSSYDYSGTATTSSRKSNHIMDRDDKLSSSSPSLECESTVNDSNNPTCRGVIGGHARKHYDETLHAYALDTETQHVWDFAGQGYVHRLIQNVDDGKIVEISDPANTTSQERSLIPTLSDTQEDEAVHRKLEGYASQYYTLLKSQLEQQRMHYEGMMQNIQHEHKIQNEKKKNDGSSELIAALRQDRNQLKHRLIELKKKGNKVVEEVAFLKNMNESLEANKEPMRQRIMRLKNQRKEIREVLNNSLPPLEEKVKQLMLKLEHG